MKLARWKTAPRKPVRLHVTTDGIKTACGALIPETATLTRDTDEWYLHTNCYNCAYRLWPQHGPSGYLRPHNSKDFPPRKECPHYPGRGLDPNGCLTCKPRPPKYWPCPRGCADPEDHNPLRTYTKCTVYPPAREPGPDGRCVGMCESKDDALHRANPGFFYDLADSAMMICYHCDQEIDRTWNWDG